MALAARPIGVTNTTNVSSGHMPSGGRNIATSSFQPIDEISAKAAVLSDPNFSFQSYANWMRSQDEDNQPPRNPTSNFDTTSTTFLQLLGQHQQTTDTVPFGQGGDGPTRQMTLDRAVSAYESTADVISNAPKTRGTSISYSL